MSESWARTWVGICEQGAHGKEHFGDGKRRTPVILQNIEADGAGAVDVAVVDACPEHDLLGVVGVLASASAAQQCERDT